MSQPATAIKTVSIDELWNIAIDLQKLDFLEVSNKAKHIANECINGSCKPSEAPDKTMHAHGLSSKDHEALKEIAGTEIEADIVASRTVALANSDLTVEPSPDDLLKIHALLFEGIYSDAGSFRASSTQDWPSDAWLDTNDPKGNGITEPDPAEIPALVDKSLSEARDKLKETATGEEIPPKITAQTVEQTCTDILNLRPFTQGNTRALSVLSLIWLKSCGLYKIL